MCLYIDEAKFKIAEKDIPCWKILEYGDLSFDNPEETSLRWFTPFTYYPVDSNIIIPAEDNVGWDIENSNITSGVIHCYIDFELAKRTSRFWDNIFVFEAIIPKGTSYIEGRDSSHDDEINTYGSKRVEIIDPEFLYYLETKLSPKNYTPL